MPPISEKRSPPILKDNVKENLSNPQALCDKLNGRVPELLEYRDSWLQEIEMYKDQVRTQLLTQHNHLHTSEGCQYDGMKPVEAVKRRVRTRSDSESNDVSKSKTSEDELVLKRPREDNFTPITNNNQIHQHRTSVANGLPQLPSKTNPLNSQVENSKSYSISSPSSAPPLNPIHLNGVHRICETKEMHDSTRLDITPPETGLTRENVVQDTATQHPTNLKTEIPSVSSSIDKSENEGSDLEDEEEFDEFLEADNVIYSDSEDEYTGHVYLNSSDGKLNTYTDATSLPSSETNYITPSSPFAPSLFPNVPAYLSFSSHAEKGPPLPPDVQKILKWKLTSIMPKVVRRVVANTGLRLIKKANDWVGTWDKHMKSPGFKVIRSYQKYNHLPGSFKIGRKDSVWRNLKSHMGKHGKKEFGFMQRTYVLPQDLATLKSEWPKYSKQDTKWIIKPPASARGTGIKVVNRWTQIPKNVPLIVQKYIERPLLINGSKFDLRLYVIVTSINPLRIYMHTDGLARFASVQYSDKIDTLDDRCMHLTNYSINKFSESYAINEDINACQGHKWTLRSLWSHFREQGINTKRLWGKIRNIVLRTILAGESGLNRMFKQHVRSKYNCYEMFGFDILLDEHLTPWLLEVNISPSLHSDQPLDLHVKGPLMQAVLNTALYQVPAKLSKEREREIVKEYNLPESICLDKRLYVTQLSPEETAKHNHFTGYDIEYREEYLDAILDDLTPDDVRCLLITEDELSRSSPLERIFPGTGSHEFLKYIDFARYYNRLLDAWEHKYALNREAGIQHLKNLCETGIHLQVPKESLKEPRIEPEIPVEVKPAQETSEDGSEINKNETEEKDREIPQKQAEYSDLDVCNERLGNDKKAVNTESTVKEDPTKTILVGTTK